MNEWSGQLAARLRALWARSAPAGRAFPGGRVLPAVAAAAVTAAVVLLAAGGRQSVEAPLFGIPIADRQELHRIAARLDVEAVGYRIGDDQRIYVADDQTARRVRALLVREDLVPAQTDPWSFFDVDRFSRTDFERNVNLQRAVTANLEQHLRSMDDIDAASVTIVVPERRLFSEEQQPVTASIVLTPHPGSDLAQDARKIAGIRRLIAFAVEGLAADNIVIVDNRGDQLAAAAAEDRRRQTRTAAETAYERAVVDALARIFARGRVQVVRLDVDGGRVTAAVVIDGVWRRRYDRLGNVVIGSDGRIRREYTPVSGRELTAAHRLIADAVGFDADRGDSVTVEHLQFDRSEQFGEEDAAFLRQRARGRALALGGGGAAAALLAVLAGRSGLFRRRRRAPRPAGPAPGRAARAAAGPAGAERSGALVRQAAALAREHPAEVARVLRAWLAQR